MKRSCYPIFGVQGRMTFPWRITKSGRIAVQVDGLWLYHNPKTGWVPLPGKRESWPHYAEPKPDDGPAGLAVLLPRVGNRKIN